MSWGFQGTLDGQSWSGCGQGWSQDSLCSQCPGSTTETEVGAGQGVPGCSIQRHPGRAARAEVCICARSTLASCLEPRWFGCRVSQGALRLCHHGKMALTVVSTDQGCPSLCYTGAALEGWLRLVWVRALRITVTVGQLGCPDPASIHICQPLLPRKGSSHLPASLAGFYDWLLYILVAFLNQHLFFFLCLRADKFVYNPSVLSTPHHCSLQS